MRYVDIDGQKMRADEINRLVIEYHLKDIGPNGELLGEKWRWGSRGLLTFAEALLPFGEKYIEIIEKILNYADDWDNFCTFRPFMCMLALTRYSDVLTNGLKEKFSKYVKDNMMINLHDTWDFVGVNDNTPAMIMTSLLLAGEYFENQDLFEIGKKRLYQMKNMLQRRGFISEYNSPTYHAITTYAFAAVANYVIDPEVREIALACEERLWQMLFCLYHRDTCQTAGPYSRAYHIDSTGHTHENRFLFYAIMGESSPVNVMNTIFSSENESNGMILHGNQLFMHISNAWLVNMGYHCPIEYVEQALNRRYPFVVRGDAELSVSADKHLLPFRNEMQILNEDLSPLLKQNDLYEYQSTSADLYSFLNNSYALGTSTKEFHCGVQTDSFHILFTRGGTAENQKEIGTVFARYLINDDMAQQGNFIYDQGRKIALQHENSAVVLYRSKFKEELVHSLKLSLLIRNYFNIIDEIRIGKEIALTLQGNWQERLSKPFILDGFVPIYVRAGEVYMVFYPLLAKDSSGSCKICVGKEEDFISISFINYEGDEKEYHRKEMSLIPNGFICEIRNNNEICSFEEFVKEFSSFDVTDRMFANTHSRYTYMREVIYKRRGLELACCYSPISEGIKYMSVNGETYRSVKMDTYSV